MDLRKTVLALFCDPEGEPCFYGSDGDRAVLRAALVAQQPMSAEQPADVGRVTEDGMPERIWAYVEPVTEDESYNHWVPESVSPNKALGRTLYVRAAAINAMRQEAMTEDEFVKFAVPVVFEEANKRPFAPDANIEMRALYKALAAAGVLNLKEE